MPKTTGLAPSFYLEVDIVNRLATFAALAAVIGLLPVIQAEAIIREVPAQYPDIQTALDDSREGDIVLVAPGTYVESLTIPRSVYLISEESGGAVIDAGGYDAIRVEHVEMFQVVGFAIHNCRAAIVAAEASGAVVDTTISGCMPINSFEDVIAFQGEADATVANVDISGNEGFDPTVGMIGMFVSGEAWISDVNISTSTAPGIQVNAATAAVLDTSVLNAGGEGLISNADQLLVTRTLIDGAEETGIQIESGSEIVILETDVMAANLGVEFHAATGSIGMATIWDSTVISSYQSGLIALSDINELTIGHTEITEGGASGIRLEDSDMMAYIHDSNISDNADYGILIGTLGTGFLESSDVTIRRCVIADNAITGIQMQDTDAMIVNNTIADNDDYGIFQQTSTDPPLYFPTFKNNIVTGAHEVGIYTDSETCNLDYSLFDDNDIDAELCIWADGIVEADPLFADANDGDFSLLPGSPAMDAGDPDPQYNDADGTRNDMGAFGGPEEAEWPEDEAPSFEFEAFDDIVEGACLTVSLPADADPEGHPTFVEWTITGTGESNGTWTAYGPNVRLCGEDDGMYEWTATATDPFGNSDSASGSVNVLNVGPGITSTMPDSATVGIDYLYAVEVFDPGYFDTYEYVLEMAPEGVLIDAFGVISWTPTADQEGDQPIKLIVRDDDGGESIQIETINVRPGEQQPSDDDDCSCDESGSGPVGFASLIPLALGLLALRRRMRA